MTTDEILLGLGLIVVLAVGAQVLATRLRLPAIIVLLIAGFAAGAATSVVDPDLLGAAFQPMVSLAVAMVLYDAGLSLDVRRLVGQPRRVVGRLTWLGVPLIWVVGTVAAALLLGLSWGAAVVLGAVLVVSGPTVVAPLLSFVRPSERVQRTSCGRGRWSTPWAPRSERWSSRRWPPAPGPAPASTCCSSWPTWGRAPSARWSGWRCCGSS